MLYQLEVKTKTQYIIISQSSLQELLHLADTIEQTGSFLGEPAELISTEVSGNTTKQ